MGGYPHVRLSEELKRGMNHMHAGYIYTIMRFNCDYSDSTDETFKMIMPIANKKDELIHPVVYIKLIEEKIYVPTLWSHLLQEKFQNVFEYQLASDTLFLPLDQRYGKEDIEFIKHYVKRFSEHCEECRKNNTNFVDFFYTKVPEITPREDGWNESDFSFINKVATEISIDRYFYKSAKRNLDAKATNLINLLTESIIPRTIKTKNLKKV